MGFADGDTFDARFHSPAGVSMSPDGTTIAIADVLNHAVRMVTAPRIDYQLLRQDECSTTTLAGSKDGINGFADGTGASVQLQHPEAISFSSDGATLAVADVYNIRLIQVGTGVSRTLAGGRVPGLVDGVATSARFNFIYGVGFSPDGLSLAIADSNNNAIRLVVVATGATRTIAGGGESGFVDGTPGSMSSPSGVSFHPNGLTLVVSDTANHAIRLVDVVTGEIRLLAGAVSGSQSGYMDGLSGEAVRFNGPHGVAFSHDGLFVAVADSGNQAIRIVATENGATSTIAGTQAGSFVDGVGTSALFKTPHDVSFSPDGLALVVADKGNHAIRRVTFNCACNVGFTGPDGEACLACLDMQFKDTIGTEICQACPGNSSSTWGSEYCVCNSGYTGRDGGPCVACEQGTWKKQMGSAACSLCPAHIFSPEASTSTHNCSCPVGYTGNVPCTQCRAGTYKNATGPSPCLDCPGNSTSPTSSSSSKDCSILCQVGLTGPDGGPCTGCVPGKYKSARGSALCTLCPAGTFSSEYSAAGCTGCPKKSYSYRGNTTCQCEQGFKKKAGDLNGGCLIRIRETFGSDNSRDFMVQVQLSMDTRVLFADLLRTNGSDIDTWWHAPASQMLSRQLAEFLSCDNEEISVGEFVLPPTSSSGSARRDIPGFYSVWVDIIVDDDHQIFTLGLADMEDSLSLFLAPLFQVVGIKTTCGKGHFQNYTLSEDENSTGCMPCDFGYFKEALDNSQCLACPKHSTTNSTGAPKSTFCECYESYVLMNVSNSSTTDVDSSNTSTNRMLPERTCVKSGVSVADARAAARVVTAIVASVVASNCAMSMSSSAATSSSGAGAGGAGVLPLVSQVQFMNQVGKVGAGQGSASVGAFSEGFGWANFELGWGEMLGIMPPAGELLEERRQAKRRDGRVRALFDNNSTHSGNSTNSTLNGTLIDEVECSIKLLFPSFEKLMTCGFLLMCVHLARRLAVLFFKEVLDRDIPTSLMFPAWEGPIFLAEYMAICDTVMSSIATQCNQGLAFGMSVLILCPMLFLGIAWLKIRRHLKRGGLAYTKNSMPNLRTLYSEVKGTPGFIGKIVNARAIWNSYQERGEWEDDEKSTKWGFLMGDYCGSFWAFSLWLLVKKLLLTFVLELLTGRANAIGALAIQICDTVLLLWMRPFISRQSDLSECLGCVSNFVAFLAVSMPIIFPEVPFLGEFGQLAATTLATAISAFLGMMSPLFVALSFIQRGLAFLMKIPSKVMAIWASVGAGGSIFLALKGSVVSNMKDTLNDEIEDHYALDDEEEEEDKNQNERDGCTSGDGMGGTRDDDDDEEEERGPYLNTHDQEAAMLVAGVAASGVAAGRMAAASNEIHSEREGVITITIDKAFEEIGKEGSPSRIEFERALVDDLAHASDLPPTSFEIIKMSAGSVIADIKIGIDSTITSMTGAEVVEDLKTQASDPSSRLRAGRLTGMITSVNHAELSSIPVSRSIRTPASRAMGIPESPLNTNDKSLECPNGKQASNVSGAAIVIQAKTNKKTVFRGHSLFFYFRGAGDGNNPEQTDLGRDIEAALPSTVPVEPPSLKNKFVQKLVEKGKSFKTTGAHTRFKLLMDSKVEMADYSNKGVFFDIVNKSKQSINILEFEAGAANGGAREATLYVCTQGRCRGHEGDLSKWYSIWNGWLKMKKSSPIVLSGRGVMMKPGEVMGFLLHSKNDGICYSKPMKASKDKHLVVVPGHVINTADPFVKKTKHDNPAKQKKYTIAGSVTYKFHVDIMKASNGGNEPNHR